MGPEYDKIHYSQALLTGIMNLRSLSIGVLLVGLVAASTTLAHTPQLADPPSPSSGEVNRQRIELGPAGEGCLISYRNITNLSGSFYENQNGKEVLDDLHMLYEGSMCAFKFGYQEDTTAPFSATIAFYVNDPLDPVPTTLLAGPYTINGLPWGVNEIEVTLPSGPFLTADVWMSVQFSSTTAGMLIVDPPTEGSSHDYFYQRPAETYLWFGGDPMANFYMEVEMEVPVPVEASSWGQIKARYQ